MIQLAVRHSADVTGSSITVILHLVSELLRWSQLSGCDGVFTHR